MELRAGVIGAGEMGSGVGGRLAANGVDVRTPLAGRSSESAERVHRAGIRPANDLAELARECTLVLSIVPPDRARGVAEAFAAAYVPRTPPPVYVDCNAVAPETARAIGAAIVAAGLPFIDAGIIGGPPSDGYNGPHIYASGDDVAPFEVLNAFGLIVKRLDGGAGLASALKMCYGGITKGFTGIGSGMLACAEENGVSDALIAELTGSQPALYAWLTRQLATMPPKAYRWVGEMQEIGSFGAAEPGVASMYAGLAQRYDAIARARDAKKAGS